MALDLTADGALWLSDFAEEVIYHPRQGQARTIRALVDRNPFAALAVPGTIGPLVHITVRNDATEGIASAEVDTGGDQVELALRLGGPTSRRSVSAILEQDVGLVRLELR